MWPYSFCESGSGRATRLAASSSMLLVKLQPTCGSGLQLPVGLGRRICFQGHSAGCHRLKSHGLWTVGHCSWSPGVDTSIMWLAVWRLASPRVSDLREERARAKQRMLRWKPQSFCCLISHRGSSHYFCHTLFITCESLSAAFFPSSWGHYRRTGTCEWESFGHLRVCLPHPLWSPLHLTARDCILKTWYFETIMDSRLSFSCVF